MRGHVKKRGKSWFFIVDVGYDEKGRRKQRYRGGFPTQKKAQEALNAVLQSLHSSSYVEPSKRTLAVFMREWLESIRATVRPSTWAAYAMLTEKHIIPALGMTPLQRLTAAQLDALYNKLLESGRRDGKGGLSRRSVAYVHATIRKALSEAVRRQLLTRNVAEQVTPPRQQPSGGLRTWSANELRAFLAHVEGDRLYGAYVLAATTGLRRGELLGLRWRDLDLNAARISVTQTLVSVNYAVSISTPKTPRGRRNVALDPNTVAILRGHRARLLEERLSLGLGSPKDDDLIFTGIEGSPLHPGQFSDRFDRLVRDAGLPRIRFHDLRHTHATLALAAGIHPKVVSERLGHSTVSITLDTYSHAIPAMQEEAASRVAALLFASER